ncbi:alpha/beta hydrolase [Methylobacterium radiodurans]|uniref:Alpha/beta hydrolase n=2 Tax=Methylobacterium radiodurans TaxID=2202828 RepID=A0A2U8VZT1_9HYPH|nr:alpha/beta hydrolase [Methylobacterium radiodurans]
MSELPVSEARAMYRRQSRHFGGSTVEMEAVADLAAAGPGGPIPLRLYRPQGLGQELGQRPAPALVYLHGGGWVLGDLESHDKVCRQIAARAGVAVVAVDYRLAPEHPAPAAAEDAIAAFGWIADSAAALGLDPARLAVGGDSAGGSLAAVVAIAARDAGLPLRGQVLIYPSTDNRLDPDLYPSRRRNAAVPPLTWEMVRYFHARHMPDPALALDWRASPILVPDASRLAPALLIGGARDVLHDEGEAYADRLATSGVPVERKTFPGMVHGFIELGGVIAAAADALDLIADWLRRRL